ncbi:MAG: hypothetical protein QM674_04095 [Burkholderiaceae bacterium]
MTPFVFKFKGLPAQRGQAMEDLRTQLPRDALVTPKTTDLVEVRLEDAEAARMLPGLQREFASLWEVTLPTYAEIKPPAFNWAIVRDKLGS